VLCRGDELRAFCVFDLIYTNSNRRRRRFTDQLSRFIVDAISDTRKSMKRKDIEKEMLAALIANERARKAKQHVRRPRKTRK
jgi:N-acyl-L-homoserine lactone synthetase